MERELDQMGEQDVESEEFRYSTHSDSHGARTTVIEGNGVRGLGAHAEHTAEAPNRSACVFPVESQVRPHCHN